MIIGLTGVIGSGKSTVAKYLEGKHGYTRINFKDGLLTEVKERFPNLLIEILSHHQNIKDVDTLLSYVPRPPLLRALLQNYGTEVRRGDDSNYWVNQWTSSVLHKQGSIVADDVRFQNEVDAVRSLGGRVVRVNGVTDVSTGHRSETEQSKFIADMTIYNHKSLDELHLEIDDMVKTITNLGEILK